MGSTPVGGSENSFSEYFDLRTLLHYLTTAVFVILTREKYCYWWCQELDQAQTRHELGLATHTGVDWDSFCREVCEISLMVDSQSDWLSDSCNCRSRI